jgi:hypothetical protein
MSFGIWNIRSLHWRLREAGFFSHQQDFLRQLRFEKEEEIYQTMRGVKVKNGKTKEIKIQKNSSI